MLHELDSPTANLRADFFAIAMLLVLALVFAIRRWLPLDQSLIGDWGSFFIPMFSFLGRELRAGELPLWNPWQFSGTPFAADPESGWGYLPAMISFSLFPLIGALAAYLTSTVLIGGIGAYVLARVLKLGPVGAFATGLIYMFGWLWQVNLCCLPYAAIGAWFPIAFIGIELSIRAERSKSSIACGLLAGFATSQMLAGWLGQGVYYAMIVIAGYIAYRTLLRPPDNLHGARRQSGRMVTTGLVTLMSGIAFDAWHLLPAIQFNLESNLVGGGYPGRSAWEQDNSGWHLLEAIRQGFSGYMQGIWWYFGGAAMVFAFAVFIFNRRWFAAPFMAVVPVVAVILSLKEPTVIHKLLYAVFPAFEALHAHYPARVLIVAFLPISLLVGATVNGLIAFPETGRFRPSQVVLAIAPAVVLLAVGPLSGDRRLFSVATLCAVAAAGVLLGVAALRLHPLAPGIFVICSLVLLLADTGGRFAIAGYSERAGREKPLPAGITSFATPSGAAAFLASQPAAEARFLGYDPVELPDPDTFATELPEFSYRDQNGEAEIQDLILNNRATLLGLPDVQGYNPLYLRRYAEFIEAMNGHFQEYHELAIYPEGIGSPLLDLLRARYLVVSTDTRDMPRDNALFREHDVVFQDSDSIVLERASAMPIAWVVHEARQIPGVAGLDMLASGAIDPRQTALVELPPPELDPIPSGVKDDVRLETYEPNYLSFTVDAGGRGLLVVAESYEQGWTATVDGLPAAVLVANHTLRGIAVPAGTSVVELRYAPRIIPVGIGITGASAIGAAIFGWLAIRDERRHRTKVISS